MNGVITAVPWRGQQEYVILWDYTALPVALDKSAICHTISKTDNIRINLLKMARYMFEKVYPNGVKSVPNIAPVPRVWNCSGPRHAAARATTSHNMRSSRNNSEAKGTWSVHNIVACSNDNCRQHFHCSNFTKARMVCGG